MGSWNDGIEQVGRRTVEQWNSGTVWYEELTWRFFMAYKAGSDVIGTSVGCSAELREAVLAVRDVNDMDITAKNYVEMLAKRLERVRKWGGAYSKISFSPQVKAMMEGHHRPVVLAAAQEMAELGCGRLVRRVAE